MPRYLGLALRGEVLLDEQGPQSHPEVLVGLGEAEPAQVQLLLRPVDLPGELVDGAAERRGQVLAESRHDAPQHVVVENPKKKKYSYIFFKLLMVFFFFKPMVFPFIEKKKAQ